MNRSMKLVRPAPRGASPRPPRRFLVVEDERDLAELVGMHLAELQATIVKAYRGDEGLDLALEQSWDLIVLDLSLPGLDGLDICRELRSHGITTPLLMLTSRSTELDRVLGLELGADDYLCKPFSTLEFMARVKALLRRVELREREVPAAPKDNERQVGELYVNATERKVTLAGQPVELTAKEFDLLWHFVRHPGQVFRRAELLDAVWGYGHEGYEHTVNSHINRLRTKIESQAGQPGYLQTVWGVGYKFVDPTPPPDRAE